MGPEALAHVLRALPTINPAAFPSLLVGLSAIDDASVYRLNDEQAIINTVDFFPPVVDDPYTFGAIAAANAMSDIYAMGGEVLLALNVVGFPENLDVEILSDILRGGADKVREAGGVVAGGHTVTDREPKFGLAVTGLVHPKRILTKGGVVVGDMLLLTKPLGTGVVTTALKRDQVDAADLESAVQSMMALNREASRALRSVPVHACTDITGFGLLGHAWEMAAQSQARLRFHLDALPWLPGAQRYAAAGCVPGGTRRNMAYLEGKVKLPDLDGDPRCMLLFDPQTSGGLLAAVAPEHLAQLVAMLQERGVRYWVVGEAVSGTGVEVV
jgi:selenide,water dikinase